MSHFIICCCGTISLGMPNGQATTQFPQAMQRGLSADCTTPSSVFLIASAGQTLAQVGSVQCMHTEGTVSGPRPRSMKSTDTIDTPRWVSHSAQAASQERQPMQREGSTKNS